MEAALTQESLAGAARRRSGAVAQALVRSHLLAGAAFVLLAVAAQAQQIYRSVGADGKVTFSDRPPVSGAAAPVAPAASGAGSGGAALPFELQQVAARYPVTLYTGPGCAPCASARSLLTARGVPFTERTVATPEDIDALQRISNDSSLPFGTIGAQHLVGYSDAEWTQFLNAAGYPAQSQLPPGYRQPPPAPLVAARRAAPEALPSAAPAPGATPVPSPSNPAGLSF